MIEIVFILVLLVAAVIWAFRTRSRQKNAKIPPSCDLRRSVVISGGKHNDRQCVLQRRAIKPLLPALTRAQINVVEVYGDLPVRRNGKPLDWVDVGDLRTVFSVHRGFQVHMFDNDAEITLRTHRNLSENTLRELIDTDSRPPRRAMFPNSQEEVTPEAPDSWSVGVLR